MGQLKGGLDMLTKPIKVGILGRERRGELEILVLEDEEGAGIGRVRCSVKEDVVVGNAGDGKTKGSGLVEVECKVSIWVGEL